ncbi:LOW QUALITY PROTEIN: serine-rich adhesin for platelets [Palaemon carinicauda]|uniref:LOW QUALITY PROTEIN: serine-rich adhesin for platelets n=1 Tax=Palaemon carinicauda TaxID=392227 RepID=UPI0035B5D7A5
MDKIRNFKHRLSMSVDKLSTSRRSKSQQRKSMPLGNAPFSESDIPGTLRLDKTPSSRPTSATELSLAPGSRPSSYCEADTLDSACLDWVDGAVGEAAACAASGTVDLDTTQDTITKEIIEMESGDMPASPREATLAPNLGDKQLKSTPTNIGSTSLMDEVMKEVEKITDNTDDVRNKRLKKDDENLVNVSDKLPLLDTSDESEMPSHDSTLLNTSDETLVLSADETPAEISKVVLRKAVESSATTLSIASTCRAESLTSGYFSDSDIMLSEKGDGSKSTFTSLLSETTEKRRSAFIPVTPEHKETNRFSFPAVPLEGQTENFKMLIAHSSEAAVTATSTCSTLMSSSAGQQTTEVGTKMSSETISTKITSSVSTSENTVVGSQVSNQETKPATSSKRESIYSRIIKKKDPSKEPIYAKVKPKLSIETSFQPIEPSAAKNNSSTSGVVKPEPKYTTVNPRDPHAPFIPQSPMSPGSSILQGFSYPSSPTSPVSPGAGEEVISVSKYGTLGPFSSLRSNSDDFHTRDTKCNTLPKEPIYSKVRKIAKLSSKDSKDPTYSKTKPKEPIYAKPLPLTPREEALQKRESFITGCPPTTVAISASTADCYGKVTVRASEISQTQPSKPAVITINNPGYAAPTVIDGASPLSPSSPISPVSPSTLVWPSASSKTTMSTSGYSMTKSVTQTSEIRVIEKLGELPQTVASPDPRPLVASETSLVESSDTESTGRAKLSQLVEELAHELEAVSRRIGSSASVTTDESKKEVLAKLLSTYDIPQNLRRVEEADETDVLEAEKALVPTSISMDELRYVDDNEDNAETIYADIPDYSQDEFVIALDDENDPRYASLTRELRHKKSGGGDSPGRVSRRTANVYANAINVVSALKVLINSKSTRAAAVLNKMSTLARPYTNKVQGSISDTTWIQRVIYHKTGHNGFDELRRYIKSGGEFCKELAAIMNERAELEANYAKGLQKLSGKLLKASKENMGTINHAWQMVGVELEQEGDLHKSIAASISDDVVRPLRQLIETQHKIRKGVESMVDKTTKNLHEWRAMESKSKKQCYGNCRENEKIQDMMLESRIGRGKTLSDKEAMKMEKQRRKAEEAVQKSDLEYYTCCVRTERARLEWESAIYKGSNCFQTLEEERLQALKDLIVKYHKNAKEAAPKLVAIANRLDEPVTACDVEKDIQTVISAKGTGENIPEQMLPDFYAEDMNNIMNRDRRREALEKFIQMLKTDLERERRGKQGVENLAKALQETPTFGGEESQQDVNDKLQHMKAMLAYLEAARYKVQCSLDELNNRPKMTHPLAKHIEVHRDKQGLSFSVLKVPPWVRGNSVDVSPASDSPTGSPNWNDRGTADGNSVQPDSDFGNKVQILVDINDNKSPASNSEELPLPSGRVKSSTLERKEEKAVTDHKVELETVPKPIKSPRMFMSAPRYPSLMIVTDEFSSQGSDREYQNAVTGEDNVDATTKEDTYYARPLESAPVVGRCKALYDYEANMYDELTIKTGDIIGITEKQPDGWWVGELDGVVGIFPATYVEEID